MPTAWRDFQPKAFAGGLHAWRACTSSMLNVECRILVQQHTGFSQDMWQCDPDGQEWLRTCSRVMVLLLRSLTWYSLCHHLPVTNSRRRFSSQAMPGQGGRKSHVVKAHL